MKQIILNNGMEIPQIGFGTYSLEKASITKALQVGYRLLDTASQYENEREVGLAVKNSQVRREDILVSSKVWNEDIKNHRTRQAFFESLKKLDLDYMDMYLIHWPVEGYPDAWLELEKLYEEGLVKAIGVCNFQRHHLEELEKIQSVKPVVNQIELHPRFHNRELAAYCFDKNIQVEAWSPFGGTGARMLQNTVLMQIAQKHGRSAAQIVIRWHLQRGVVPLPRSTNEERMQLNLDVFDFALDEEDMTRIESIDTNKRLGADPDDVK